MANVFVSYARSTVAEANAVVEALRAAGFTVCRDDELPPHRSYAEVIEERLKAASARRLAMIGENTYRNPVRYAVEAALLGHLGRTGEARAALALYRTLSARPIEDLAAAWFHQPEHRRLLLEGVAKAQPAGGQGTGGERPRGQSPGEPHPTLAPSRSAGAGRAPARRLPEARLRRLRACPCGSSNFLCCALAAERVYEAKPAGAGSSEHDCVGSCGAWSLPRRGYST